MCDRQFRESLAPPSASSDSAQGHTDIVEREEERDEDWHHRLRSLEEWICELLIKNQELRMSLLDSTTNYHSRGADQ
jgi:hypothetical protein